MKLKEFLNSNQNQWKGLFTPNQNFKVELWTENGFLKTLDTNYYKDEDFLLKYRNKEINFWEIKNKNHIIVNLE